jgi:8-oxo-dGTP pyrophosphatase MutT (NUDIX family)
MTGATTAAMADPRPADLRPADVAGQPGLDKPIRDASTVVLLRDADSGSDASADSSSSGRGGPEVYMVQRHRGNKFMANAHVFVGGRVDDDDCDERLEPRLCGRDAAARAQTLGYEHDTPCLSTPIRACIERARGFYVAAVRETFEESGILLAVDREGRAPETSPELTRLRDELNDGKLGFAALLEQLELTLPLDRLRLLTHWITPPFEVKRYDTQFFVARAPVGQEASFDPRETTAGMWCSPRGLLEQHHAEQIKLAPPTYTVLEDLAAARSVDEALTMTADVAVPGISPRVLEGEDALTFLMPDDHRFDDASSAGGREHYMVREAGHWRRVRSD